LKVNVLPACRKIERINYDPLNEIAREWLAEAKALSQAPGVYLLDLAWWGLEEAGLKLSSLDRGVQQTYLSLSIGQMFVWDPANWMEWLLSNPNTGESEEQRANLMEELECADGPAEAALRVLEVMTSRLQAHLPVFRRAASDVV
jgi:hypothetical protein